MRVGDPVSSYYLTDNTGSVRNLVSTVSGTTQSVANYTYCPTGNLSDGGGTYEFTNPWRMDGEFYDWRYLTSWVDGVQIDTNSRNGRSVPNLPVIFDPQTYVYLASLRTPDYWTYSVSYTPPPPPIAPDFPQLLSGVSQEVVDRYGQKYIGFGSSVGTPGSGFSFSATAGYILQLKPPSSSELSNFITGRSMTLSGGIEGAGAVTWGLPGQTSLNAFAFELGAMSSHQAGVTFISDTVPIP